MQEIRVGVGIGTENKNKPEKEKKSSKWVEEQISALTICETAH